MKKDAIEVPASAIPNLQMVIENKTNLVLVPIYFLNLERWFLKVEDKINAAITWQQYGYACAIPNGFGLLKIKRGIPLPTEQEALTTIFEFDEDLFFGIKNVFEKKSVVLATNYFSGKDIPEKYRTNPEVARKLNTAQPGDKIFIFKKETGEKLFATILSVLRSDNCKEMFTEKIGCIPFDYSSVVFEITNVEIQ